MLSCSFLNPAFWGRIYFGWSFGRNIMEKNPQTFANHTRYDPPFHFFVTLVFLLNVILTGYYFVRALFSGRLDNILTHSWVFIFTIALLVAMTRIRSYPLHVQDRVIRLEERLRLMSVLQEPLRSRISELQDTQLIGLRFAPDEELPGLVQRALDEKLSRADIKKAIVNWRADYSRI
jgi:hypothetical protein